MRWSLSLGAIDGNNPARLYGRGGRLTSSLPA